MVVVRLVNLRRFSVWRLGLIHFRRNIVPWTSLYLNRFLRRVILLQSLERSRSSSMCSSPDAPIGHDCNQFLLTVRQCSECSQVPGSIFWRFLYSLFVFYSTMIFPTSSRLLLSVLQALSVMMYLFLPTLVYRTFSVEGSGTRFDQSQVPSSGT